MRVVDAGLLPAGAQPLRDAVLHAAKRRAGLTLWQDRGVVVSILLAAAAVAVLAGIAAASTGYGGELVSAEPSRPGPALPAGRFLLATDLRRISFSTGLWGYLPAQVDGALDRAAAALAERDVRIADLESRLRAHQSGSEDTGSDARRAGGEANETAP